MRRPGTLSLLEESFGMDLSGAGGRWTHERHWHPAIDGRWIALHNAGITPSRDIVMICTADEESGGERGIRWMIENHYDEIDAEYVLDEGGMGIARCTRREQAGVRAFPVGDKVIAWLRLRAKGTAGHGSQPIPDNANLILLEAIRKAMELPAGSKQNPVVEEMRRAIGPLVENKFNSAIQRNTISLTSLTAGVGSPPRPNVIPSTSEATLDCRLPPGTNVVMNCISRHEGPHKRSEGDGGDHYCRSRCRHEP